MKYNSVKTTIDDITFDSKVEASFYKELKAMQDRGDVRQFSLQPVYLLQPAFKKNGRTIRKIEYIGDFLVEYSDGSRAVIDVKGILTDVFKIKRKLFDYYYPDLELKVVKKVNGEWVELNGKTTRRKYKAKRTKI